MSLPLPLRDARDRFKRHLDGCDWSELTSGRKRILEVFLQLASAEGYSAVTMRTLAREANVTAASIYFHFPAGRSDIVIQSLRWHYSNWGYRILEAVDKVSEPQQFWDELVAAVTRCQISIPASDLWDLLVRIDRAGGFLQMEFREEIDHWLDLCAGLFQSSAEAIGYVVDRGRIDMIMSMLDTAGNWSQWNGDAADLDAIAEEAVMVSRAIVSACAGRLRRTATQTKIVSGNSR